MSDYNSGVYREQRTGNLVVKAGNTITLTSGTTGGALNVNNGATIALTSGTTGGVLTVGAGGRIRTAVISTAATTSTTIYPSGIVCIASTSTAGKEYNLSGAPSGGEELVVNITVSGTSTAAFIDVGSGIYASATTTHRYIKATASGAVILRAINATRWLVAAGTVSTTTSAA